MKLIDADELRGCAIIRPHNHTDFQLIGQCSEQLNHNDIPTAYDVDRVVEQILNVTVNLFCGRSNGKTLFATTLEEYRRTIINIVKEGGVNGK